ncbi:PD-(D/E)XK nuclease family protein [Desulfovibrio sp. OttesenSCG-928-C06]|nr:PD-(D/E)XK nuclease family protein [Desulfovibrio sp. OttesenSCG-928-C06]
MTSAYGLNSAAAPGHGRGTPFRVVGWQNDFLATMLDHALAESGGNLSGCLFIFPHARPALYLERLLRQDTRITKPILMPEIMPVHSVFQKIRLELAEPALTAGKLDQIGLLLECVRAEQRENPGSINSLPTTDAQAFFPWGVRLADLFEDCFIHGIKPTNFMFMEGELAEYAAALLSRLGSIHSAYMRALKERNWTTSALTAFEIAEHLRSSAALPSFLQDKRIFIAGFYSPNGTEDTLFRRLWANGAEILLHADPALTEPASHTRKVHWSCAGLEQWRAAWRSSFELLGQSTRSKPEYHYYSGFDVHSQLAALQKVLGQDSGPDAALQHDSASTEYALNAAPENGDNAGSESRIQEGDTAVILPDADLLLPVLHHLSERELNISMGFPLEKTALARLLECIICMQENKRQGGYYWKDCVRLIRHPYVKMLEGDRPDDGQIAEDGTGVWRSYLHKLEKALRSGKRYPDLPAVMRQTLLTLENESARQTVSGLLEALIRSLLEDWRELASLSQMASSLETLCAMLKERGERLWPSFPIDAECLYRFMQNVIPQLRNSALSSETLAENVLFTILRQMVRDERVPFDAFPLTALQLMGLLESRLLRFKRVFILEGTDDLLPGAASSDPLLPDNLRRELGLPDLFRKQQMVAYYFFRLLNGAEEVHLFWEEGIESQGLQEAKKLKSRFVEELLWQEEKKAGKLLEPVQFNLSGALPGKDAAAHDGKTEKNSAYLQIACAPAALNITDYRQPLDGEAGKLMSGYLSGKALSASKINYFLTCPLTFYLQELARLKPLDEVLEGDDPGETGQLLHDSFSRFYGKKLGQLLQNQEQEWPELARDFRLTMDENQIIADFPQDAQAALRRITPLRLERYLGNQPGNVKILALETEANARLTLPDGSVLDLTGRLDRLDERPFPQLESVELDPDGETASAPAGRQSFELPEKGLVILDYKTGKISPPVKGFWTDDVLWASIFSELENMKAGAECGSPTSREQQELMRLVAEQLNRNIQLPLYLYLLRHGRLDRAKGAVCDEPFDTRLVMNAAWIELRDKGEERYLLGEEELFDLPDILDNKLPALLGFILQYMKSAACLEPERGEHCAYCAYASLCSRLSV